MFYKQLLVFRKQSETIKYGDFINQTQGNGYFAYKRTYKNACVIVVCNFETEREIVLPREIDAYRLVLQNYNDRKKDETMFRPFEIAVYEK